MAQWCSILVVNTSHSDDSVYTFGIALQKHLYQGQPCNFLQGLCLKAKAMKSQGQG